MQNKYDLILKHIRDIERQTNKNLSLSETYAQSKIEQKQRFLEDQKQKEIVDKVVDSVLKNLELKINVDVSSIKEIIEKGLKR